MTIESSAIDRIYRLQGKDATYTPSSGPAKTVKVLVKRPDTLIEFGETQVRSEKALFEVRVSEAATPKGGTLLYDGTTYDIQAATREDPDRLTWTLDVKPQ